MGGRVADGSGRKKGRKNAPRRKNDRNVDGGAAVDGRSRMDFAVSSRVRARARIARILRVRAYVHVYVHTYTGT